MTYSGLTLVLSEASRHDKEELISGYAGSYLWNILVPFHRGNIDLRLSTCEEPYLEGTKVVILLGQKSLDLLHTDNRLDIVHGYPFIRNEIIFIPTFTPQESFDRMNYFGEDEDTPAESEDTAVKTSGRTQRRNYKFWLYQDIKKSLRILVKGLSIYEDSGHLFYPNPEPLIETLTTTKNNILFIDIETDKNLNLTCFGFSFADTHTRVVPWKLYTKNLAYEHENCYKIIQALAIAFRDNLVVAHNSCFDLFVLAFRYKIPFPKKIYDTMLAFHRCYPEVEKSLARVISFFLDVPYHKSEGVYDPQNHSQQESLWNYNAKDVETLKLIYPKIVAESKRLNCGPSVEQINSSIRPYLTIMFQGIRLDTKKVKALYEEFHDNYIQLTRCLQIVVNKPDFNPRSPKQVDEYLYGDLRLDRPAKDFTNEKQLLKILTKNNIPSIKLILACRSNGKAASGLKFKTFRGDRFTTSYKLDSDTYRLRSQALLKFPPEKGYGGNAQNIDKEKVGEIFIPDEGKVFIKVDQSGADALIVSYLVRNAKYRSLFLNGIKPHTYMAMIIFCDYWKENYPDCQVDNLISMPIPLLATSLQWNTLAGIIKKDKLRYYVGKKTIHSASYGVKPPTLQGSFLLDTNGLFAPPLSFCRDCLGTFHNTCPEIQDWQAEIRETLTKTRKLHNLFGYPRGFYQPFGDELWKSGYAFIPQSTVAIITNKCITNLQTWIEDSKFPMDILQNEHDGILVQCDKEITAGCAIKLKEAMEQELVSPRGEKFRMRAEVSIGKNLKDMEEYKV